ETASRSSAVASAQRARIDHALAFLNGHHLVRGGSGDRVDAAAWPPNANLGDALRVAEAERERQLALRTVARAGPDQLPARASPRHHDVHPRADAVAIRRGAAKLHAQRVVAVAAPVPPPPPPPPGGARPHNAIAGAVGFRL